MAIQLNITVVDITATLAAGYTHIKVYRSAEETSGFAEITTSATLIPLQAGNSSYTFTDGSGTTVHWYRTTFIDNSNVVSESAFSASFQGTFTDNNFYSIHYPEEAVFTSGDRYIIDRIRNLIGDPKELTRDYVSVETGYSSISVDGSTHSLSNPKGWPLSVILDDQDYTSLHQPYVNDYQFITFSGIQINTTSGTLDVWYYHFRNSDTEILRTYNGLTPPPQLDLEDMTFELSAVCVAIEILEKEFRLFSSTSGSEVDIFQEIRIDPSGGLSARLKDLESLRKRKDELIEEIIAADSEADVYGVLID